MSVFFHKSIWLSLEITDKADAIVGSIVNGQIRSQERVPHQPIILVFAIEDHNQANSSVALIIIVVLEVPMRLKAKDRTSNINSHGRVRRIVFILTWTAAYIVCIVYYPAIFALDNLIDERFEFSSRQVAK